MPKLTRTRKVKPIKGEPLRYLVESWGRNGNCHMVDLTENGGNGACSCEDFSCRCFPNLKESNGVWTPYGNPERPSPKRTQCAHIAAARFKFLNDTLRGISEQLNSQDPSR
jgi:hypothetical protein